MKVRVARIVALVPLLIAAAAVAQRSADRVGDVPRDQRAPADERVIPPAPQLSEKRAAGDQPPSQIGKPENAGKPVDQVQRPITAHSGTAQVAREPRRVTGSPQLGSGERSARGAQAISKPSDGRQTAIVRVGGSDRCDPQAPDAASAACKAVIETRSAEFKAPTAAATSPEQRLLLDQERAEMRSVRGAVQRVGRNDIDANAIETQTLAAITLGVPADDGQPPAAVDPSAPTALESIIRIIGAAQGAPPPN